MSEKNEITIDVKLKSITDKVEKKKDGKKTIRTVTFTSDKGLSITWKADKDEHPLKNWDKTVFDEQEDMVLLLELPMVKQKKIDEFTNNKKKTKK